MPQGGKIIQRQVLRGRDVEVFAEFAEKLCFLDAIYA